MATWSAIRQHFRSARVIITNKRVAFRGDMKSFALRLDKLLELQLFKDGIRLTDDKGKPRMVTFASEENADVVGASLSYAINQYGAA